MINLNRLKKRAGISKTFVAKQMGFSSLQSLNVVEKRGQRRERLVKYLEALTGIRDNLDLEIDRVQSRLE